ncbi:F-box protein [Robbsia andropogonis]|uniref:F-box protein n=1 Tax=Robbsia andropogonis TaxID=28092 RepID=UPI0004656AC7|nr:F-box protein [Robbsia andropogonis]
MIDRDNGVGRYDGTVTDPAAACADATPLTVASTADGPHGAESERPGAQTTWLALSKLPSDIQRLVFTALPFRAFVCLLRVCKAWNATALTYGPVGERITEMGRAMTGRDIWTALQRNAADAAMPPEWEATLLLSFASKVAHVELHDHGHLTGAWMQRLQTLKAIPSDGFASDVVSEIDALQWFAQPPGLRYTQCDGLAPELFIASGYIAAHVLSSKGMTRILESISPYHFHPIRSYCALYRMVDSAANTLWVAACETQPSLDGTKVSLPLLRLYAWSWLMKDDLTVSVSDVLRDKFGIALDCQRRELDPVIAERIAVLAATTHMSVSHACDRWRTEDDDFRDVVEQHCLRQIPLKMVRGRDIYDRLDTLPQCSADLARRIRDRLWHVETNNDDIFAGDAVLAADFADLYWAVAQAHDMEAWRCVLDKSALMSWRVAPVLMQQLSKRLFVITQMASPLKCTGFNIQALFQYFIAWRDRVLPCCLAEREFDLAARAYAAPINVLCQAQNARTGFRERSRWATYPAELMDTAHAGFANLSPRYWYEILESLYVRVLPPTCSAQKAEWMEQFLRSPVATARYPSAEFASNIIVHASRIWFTLPDAAIDTKTRLDVFCERFDLDGMQRDQLRMAILEAIGTRVLTNDCPLDDALRESGFQDDVDAVRLVEHKIWHRALRVAMQYPDEARDQLIRDTRGSAFLRNHAAIFLAGTTGVVALERM